MPQGSIIGPILFLVFINDVVEEINSSIRLFADDISLYIVVDDPLDSAIKLNTDLSRIDMWASMWLVTYIFSKSESLIFSRKVNQPCHSYIYVHYLQVNEVTSHKHLSIYLSRDCTWNEHIEHIKLKPMTGKEYTICVV